MKLRLFATVVAITSQAGRQKPPRILPRQLPRPGHLNLVTPLPDRPLAIQGYPLRRRAKYSRKASAVTALIWSVFQAYTRNSRRKCGGRNDGTCSRPSVPFSINEWVAYRAVTCTKQNQRRPWRIMWPVSSERGPSHLCRGVSGLYPALPASATYSPTHSSTRSSTPVFAFRQGLQPAGRSLHRRRG